MIDERYELAVGRIRQMMVEDTVEAPFREFFQKTAEFVLMIHEVKALIADGTYKKLELAKLEEWNHRLYEDILPDAYGTSYGNPAYAVSQLGEEYGQLLSFLYTELRGCIAYVFEQKTEYLDILFELLIEIYNQFEAGEPEADRIKESIYWYASDYCDVFVADRLSVHSANSRTADRLTRLNPLPLTWFRIVNLRICAICISLENISVKMNCVPQGIC